MFAKKLINKYMSLNGCLLTFLLHKIIKMIITQLAIIPLSRVYIKFCKCLWPTAWVWRVRSTKKILPTVCLKCRRFLHTNVCIKYFGDYALNGWHVTKSSMGLSHLSNTWKFIIRPTIPKQFGEVRNLKSGRRNISISIFGLNNNRN